MAEQLNFQINIGGQEKTINTLREFKVALKEAEFQALKLSEQFGETDPRVIKLRQEIGALRDRLNDSAEATANFAKGAGAFPAITKAVQGIASGFTAVQGAIGLIGVESKDLEKQLLKVQSALALSQGLEGVLQAKDAFVNLIGIIRTGVVQAFTALRAAIGATGIGLLVISLGTIIVYWDKIVDKFTKAFPILNNLGSIIGNLVNKVTDFVGITSEAERNLENFAKAIEKVKKANENQIKILESQGGKEKEIYQIRISQIDQELKYYQGLQKTKGKLTEEEYDAVQSLETEKKVLFNNETNRQKELTKKNQEQIEKRKQDDLAAQKEKEQREKAAFDIQVEAYKATLTDRQKALYEIEEKYEQQRADLIRAGIYDFTAIERQKELAKEQVRKEFNDKEFDENAKKVKDFIDYLKERKKAEDDVRKTDEQRRLEAQQLNAVTAEERKNAELAALSSEYSEKYALAVKNKEDLVALDELYAAKSNEINTKYSNEQKKTDQATLEFKQKMLAQTAQLLGDLADLVGRNTRLGKVLALGQIATDTALAISSLTKNSEANPSNSVTFGGAGALQFASGLIRILANVKRAKDILTSNNPTTTGAPPAQAGFGGAPAPLSPFPTASVTNLSQETINALGNQAVRAYVVETDMTTNQQRIQAIRQRARFG